MSSSPLNLAIVVGSVREGRFGPTVANWFAEEANKHGGYATEVIDLADYDIPASMTPNASVQAFAEKIDAADAIVVITQEYNHSFGGTLKVAIDALRDEWKGKPVGFVSYGGMSGGLRAVEALRVVFAELHATTIRETVAFPMYYQNWNDGAPNDGEQVAAAAQILLGNLEWWAVALRNMRESVPYGQPVSAALSAD